MRCALPVAWPVLLLLIREYPAGRILQRITTLTSSSLDSELPPPVSPLLGFAFTRVSSWISWFLTLTCSVFSAPVCPNSSWFSPSCLSLRDWPDPHFCFCTDSCLAARSQGLGSRTAVHSGWRASQGLALTLLPCDNCLQPASGFQGQRVGHRAMETRSRCVRVWATPQAINNALEFQECRTFANSFLRPRILLY